jgi:DNA-binding response OmpR family regulator
MGGTALLLSAVSGWSGIGESGVGKGMTGPLIAVVDDDNAFVDLMREVLTDEGYRVVVGTAEEDAAAMVAREQPALTILDLRMTEAGSGITILHTLRDDPSTAALPVLICSADLIFLRDHADDLRALGCQTLPKPFDLDALLGTIRVMLGNSPVA